MSPNRPGTNANGGLARRAASTILIAGVLLMSACGGGGNDVGGGGNPPPALAASFAPSGTAASADGVRLVAGPATGAEIVLRVAIGGPTTSQDVYSFVFDVVLGNTAVAAYVPGSATMGDALVLDPGQGSSVQAVQSGNRVVVGVTKTGGGAGNGVGAGESTVVNLTFRVRALGTCSLTFAGSPGQGNPTGDPAALDSTGTVIPTVTFDGSAAAVVAN